MLAKQVAGLLDDVQMAACISYSKLEGLKPAPTLFFEFHGTAASVQEQATQAEEIAEGFGAAGFQWATDPAERARLWRARHDAYWAALAVKPGHQGIATDAIVPISKLAEAILGAQEDIKASGLTAPIVGHVGDGNFHTVILVPPEPGGLDRAAYSDRCAWWFAGRHRLVDGLVRHRKFAGLGRALSPRGPSGARLHHPRLPLLVHPVAVAL